MAISNIATTVRDAMCDAFVDAIDDGTGPGIIEIYTAGFATLLATLTFSDPAFDDSGSAGGNADGVATADSITSDSSADDTGTAAVFSVKTSSGVERFRGTVSTSGADINFNTTSFTSGSTISITSMTVTMPAS